VGAPQEKNQKKSSVPSANKNHLARKMLSEAETFHACKYRAKCKKKMSWHGNSFLNNLK
jgi:hypothetical protein